MEDKKGEVQMKWEDYISVFSDRPDLELGSVIDYSDLANWHNYGELIEVLIPEFSQDGKGYLTLKGLDGVTTKVAVDNVNDVFRFPESIQELAGSVKELEEMMTNALNAYGECKSSNNMIEAHGLREDIDRLAEINRLMLRSYGNWQISDSKERGL